MFSDYNFTDIDYHNTYKTIHHLIVDLIKSDKSFDPRLVYLACAYILSHRGHFLIEVDKDNIDKIKKIDDLYNNFLDWFNTMEYEYPFYCTAEDFGNVLLNNTGINNRIKAFKEKLFGGKKPDTDYPIDIISLLKLISGAKIKLSSVFKNKEYESLENNEIRLGDDDFDIKFDSYAEELEDGDAELITAAKSIYDWSLLSKILNNNDYISEAKVEIYEQHKEDLKLLKRIIKKYLPEKYNEVFKLVKGDINNYTKYSKNIKSSKVISYSNFSKNNKIDDFCGYIKKLIKDIVVSKEDEADFELLKYRVENNILCPKQVYSDNRVIPYQLYYVELKKILENACRYIPELNDSDKYGSVADKILSIMSFRIPYFVGPLVDKSKSQFAWMVRKAEGRILPWNFYDKVDIDKSEEEFIRRMVRQCSYLAGEEVLPKNSLLYCKFNVLNEINNIKINQENISTELKQEIYNELFKKRRNVTRKALENYLYSNGYMGKENKIDGIDIAIKSSLKSYHDFKNLLTNNILTEDEVEKIIARITITTDKNRLKKWLIENFNLSQDDVKYICKLNYKDYGRLSERFLTDIIDENEKNGSIENPNIITMLWETNNNIMELLSSNYNYSQIIQSLNQEYYNNNPKTLNEMFGDMYIPHSVKRAIIRTFDIIKEIVKIMNCPPEKIFIEMARGGDSNNIGKRTTSRRESIKTLLKDCEDIGINIDKLMEQLDSKTDDQLRSDALYLYFTQLGKCMYSGEDIDLNNFISEIYDIDHIYPFSKSRDDSLENKVLVKSKINGDKSDIYPIGSDIRNKMHNFWKALKNKKLISDEKFKKLTRATPLTDEELAGFINRQLVETRQSTKAVATMLKEMLPDTEIIYVKAGLVSEFRHSYDLLKSREINDFHHGKDAYLNIVVGNVYNTKFTKNPLNFVKNTKNKRLYSLKITSLLEHDIVSGNNVAWIGTKDSQNSTINTVKKTMASNSLRYVTYTYKRKGGLFNQNPERAGSGSVRLKKNLPVEKYGGYNDTTATCFMLVKYYLNVKSGIAIIPLELMYADKFINDSEFAKEYTINTLTRILKLKEKDCINNVEFPLGKRLIKINTLIDIDGFRANIAQKTSGGSQIVLGLGLSLVVDKESHDYIQKLESTFRKLKDQTISRINTEYTKINKEDNLKLYNLLNEKINNRVYRVMLKKAGGTFGKGGELFENLELEEQVETLINMLRVLKSGRSSSCDLRKIGGGKTAATMKLNANLLSARDIKSIRIIDQSPTGLYEKVSDNLLEL